MPLETHYLVDRHHILRTCSKAGQGFPTSRIVWQLRSVSSFWYLWNYWPACFKPPFNSEGKGDNCCSIYRHPVIYTASHFGRGHGTIWLSDLSCVGHETDISLCPNNGWGKTSCVHENDIGLNCGMKISTRWSISK